MAIISYDFGHMEGKGKPCQDTSAKGYLYEYKVVREYGQVCVDVLKNAGHTLIDCTPQDGTCATLGQSLSYRANKSNQSNAMLHLCFHANSFKDESANGVEVEYSSVKGSQYARSVLNEICKLGFKSRGIKNPALYMTGSNVNAVSILLEPFFVSNKSDCSLYNPIILGNAIAKGVLNIIGGNYNPISSNSNTATSPVSSNQPRLLKLTSPLMYGEDVKELQQDLVTLGLNLTVDGYYGQECINAVKQFQKLHTWLTVDGIVGESTRKAIKDSVASKNKAKSEEKVTNNKLHRVQIGAFKDETNAKSLLKELESKGFKGYIKEE